jgi:Tfp pilus assembly protein PilN
MFGLTSRISNIVGAAAGGLVLLLAIALLITRTTLHARTADRDKAVAALAAEHRNFETTMASLTSCQASIDAQNKAIDAAKAAGGAAAQAAVAAVDAAGADKQKLAATVAQLQDAANKVPPGRGCPASDAYLAALREKGL